MAKTIGVLFLVLIFMTGVTAAQDARSVLQAASTAMGAANLRSVQYSGTGWNAAFGQAYSPADDWPRFEVTSYTRTIDYDSKSLKEETIRRQGNYPQRGGGGTPIQGEQRQNAFGSGGFAWNLNEQKMPNPQPNAAEMRQLGLQRRSLETRFTRPITPSTRILPGSSFPLGSISTMGTRIKRTRLTTRSTSL